LEVNLKDIYNYLIIVAFYVTTLQRHIITKERKKDRKKERKKERKKLKNKEIIKLR
jgi:hypothetical protein